MTPLDLQVNGFGGVDFNSDALTAGSMHDACVRLREAGGSQILATVITAEFGAMERRLAALVRFRESDPLVAETVVGIHIEGPFINETPGYVGAHPVAAVMPADADSMRRLLDAAGGLTKIVTLAPERDAGFAVTRMLADAGICVAAGHCNPDLEELRGAIDNGLSMFTHLGNGCPMQLHRHDNIIQRVLSLSDELWVCFIADGVHIPFPALKNYLRCVGNKRAIVVTDAISAAGLGPGTYSLGDQEIVIGDDLMARSPDASHFIGSTVTMARTIENLIGKLGMDAATVKRLVEGNPRKALAL